MTKHTKQAIIVSIVILLVLCLGIGIAVKHREIKWWYWWWQYNRAETLHGKNEVLEKYANDAAVSFLIRALEKDGLLAKGEFKPGEAGAKPEQEAKWLYRWWHLKKLNVSKNEEERIFKAYAEEKAVPFLLKIARDKSFNKPGGCPIALESSPFPPVRGGKTFFYVGSYRYEALRVLGRIGDRRAIDTLIDLAQAPDDFDWTLQGAAIEALGRLGDRRAVNVLTKTLEDTSFTIREYAANALARLGDVRAIEPLKAALAAEKQKQTRRIMTWAIEKLRRENR